EFSFVKNVVYQQAGIVLQPGKEYLVETRLSTLAKESGLADVSQYVAALISRPCHVRLKAVVDALTTHETSWFRDSFPFQALTESVLPSIVAALPSGRPVRIWSAACSTGQEPYSLSMLLGEEL